MLQTSHKRKKLKSTALSLALASLMLVSPTSTLFAEEAASTVSDEEFRRQTEELFRQAVEKRDTGDIFSSIEDFQTILSNQPKLHRARLEMAVAFYQTYKFEQAVKEAQIVLDDPDTPPNVRVSILAFMAQVKQDAEKLSTGQNTWKFPVEFGYVYDTNVNVGPTGVADTGLLPGAGKTSDSGFVASAGIEHTFQTGKRYDWGSEPTTLLWQSGANVYIRDYINEDDYDLHVISLRTGPTFVTTGSWRANLTWQEDIIAWGGDKYAIFSYLLPSYTWHWGDTGFESTIDGIISRRDYSKDGYKGRNSVYLAPRVSVGYTFYDAKVAVQSGIQYINENASDSFYSNDAVNVYARGNWKFLEHSSLYGGYSHTQSRYDSPYDFGAPLVDPTLLNAGWGNSRDEIERKYTIGFTHTFKDFGCLTDWTLKGEVVHTRMDSNLKAYDYSRSESMLTLSRRF